MVKVREVKTKKDIRDFVNFSLKLYKNNEYFVPPIYMDELAIFTDKNAYLSTCDQAFFLAEKDGKTVGRIQVIVQKAHNDLTGEKRVRFSRFDAIDDKEVSRALFTAVEDYAKRNGFDIVCGPLGYSDLEREGLLIEGFSELSTYEEQYNYSYYQALIEDMGYEKEVDWLEYKLTLPDEKNPKIERVAEHALKRANLHRADFSKLSVSQIVDKYKDGIFHCIDECYKHLYGTVPFDEKSKKQILDSFKLVLNKKLLEVILDENENVVAFALALPSLSKALQKSGGKITLGALIRLLKAIKNPDIIDLALIGVLPEYQNKGINAVALCALYKMLGEDGIKHCETNLNLESNWQVQAQWKYFNAVNHKRRRSFIKKL
ncbi:MAG: N-acetyltransferase [Clostridiales bacterium]|nr:N-acetyltransferase [Clostridiales bacterium]